jgi:hypothetical protein
MGIAESEDTSESAVISKTAYKAIIVQLSISQRGIGMLSLHGLLLKSAKSAVGNLAYEVAKF